MPLPVTQDEYIPWGTLRYLIGEAMYGGRVSDSFDRRILTTYLDEYLGDFLFDTFQPFHFYHTKDCDISIPPLGLKDVYVKSIEGLPLVQSPEVGGGGGGASRSGGLLCGGDKLAEHECIWVHVCTFSGGRLRVFWL